MKHWHRALALFKLKIHCLVFCHELFDGIVVSGGPAPIYSYLLACDTCGDEFYREKL